MTNRAQERAIGRFVLLYALAWGGGAIAYTPLLTILLPVQVASIAGRQAGVDWLAWIALVGAIAASIGGIAFGYLSDITRNRRGWIAGGLLLSCVLLVATARANSLPLLMTAVVCWQLALNMMLAPLTAWAGDVVPNRRKGLLGGSIAFAPAMGALSGAVVTQPGVAEGAARLWLVAAIVVLMVLPILLFKAPALPAGEAAPDADGAQEDRSSVRPLRMWLSRLAVQVAEATLFVYLYFWLVEVDPGFTDNQTARLLGTIMIISAPVALVVGRWSDCLRRPMLPLQVCALVSASGLVAMAAARTPTLAVCAFALFGLASAVFLALHSAQTLRVLPRPDRRGRDLGVFNLANTLPSMVMPWLAMTIVPTMGFPVLFLLLALLSCGAAVLLSPVRALTR